MLNLTIKKEFIKKSSLIFFFFPFFFFASSNLANAANFSGDPMNRERFESLFCTPEVFPKECSFPSQRIVTSEAEIDLLYGMYKQAFCTEQYSRFKQSSPSCGGRGSVTFGSGIQAPGIGGLAGNNAAGTSSGDPLESLEVFISRIIGFLTTLAGIFFIVYFFLGALSWITAGGDTGKIQKARDQIVQGVIGLIVIVGAYAVVGIIGSVIGIDILNPAAQLRTIFGI
jgi:hypothetical protein